MPDSLEMAPSDAFEGPKTALRPKATLWGALGAVLLLAGLFLGLRFGRNHPKRRHWRHGH
jgi:hypothetical protein